MAKKYTPRRVLLIFLSVITQILACEDGGSQEGVDTVTKADEPKPRILAAWLDVSIAAQNKHFKISRSEGIQDPTVIVKEQKEVTEAFAKLVEIGELERISVVIEENDKKSIFEWYGSISSLLPDDLSRYGAFTLIEMLGMYDLTLLVNFSHKRRNSITMHIPVGLKDVFDKKLREKEIGFVE